MSEWINVKDRLPEDRNGVLFWCAEFGEVCKGHYSYDAMGWHDEDTSQFLPDTTPPNVTHWQSLPEAPTK